MAGGGRGAFSVAPRLPSPNTHSLTAAGVTHGGLAARAVLLVLHARPRRSFSHGCRFASAVGQQQTTASVVGVLHQSQKAQTTKNETPVLLVWAA